MSTLISTRLSRESIYTVKLLRRGIDVFRTRSLDVLKAFRVEECLRRDIEKVSPELSAAQLAERLLDTAKSVFYVTDAADRLVGVIEAGDLGRVLTHRQGLERVLLAEDLASESVPVCTPAESLSQALHKLERSGRPELPVVAGEKDRTLLGALRYTDVVARYNRELLTLDTAGELASRVRSAGGRMPTARLAEGYSVMEWDPPRSLWGLALQEARLPARYGVRVILIKRRGVEAGREDHIVPELPGPGSRIGEHDALVVYGRDEDLERIRAL